MHLQKKQSDGINKPYLLSVSLLTFVLPIVACGVDNLVWHSVLTFDLFAKWFIFSAVGLRLFIAGIKQTTNPAFTAKTIFHIDSVEAYPIVRELGFANLCFGLLGITSLFKPEWRVASAFASGLYYVFAGVQHLIKKPAGKNEQFALWTDLIIAALVLAYFFMTI